MYLGRGSDRTGEGYSSRETRSCTQGGRNYQGKGDKGQGGQRARGKKGQRSQRDKGTRGQGET